MRTALLAAFALVASPLPLARAQDSAFDLEKTRSVLTELIEGKLEEGVASISIALVRGDEIVWTAAFGHSNVRMKAPATPETIYVTGSTFKAVTATALMQLVEQGLIELDDPINEYLGEHAIEELEDHPITFRHILSHASGLTAGENTKDVWSRSLPMSLAELAEVMRPIRPPEARFEYNNYAYGLAGYLVERISGESYEDYIVEHVLKPLGIETPGPVHPTPEMVERMALPYVASADGPVPVAQTFYDVYPAGDIYLTAEDMARFLGAHLNGGAFQGGRILSEGSVAETHRAQFFEYGLGWGVSRGNPSLIAHGGGVSGFATMMMGDTEACVGVYAMSNSGQVEGIARAAIALLKGEEYVPPAQRASITVDAEALEAYVGRYEVVPGFVLTISRDEQRLFVQATGQARHELFAESESEFFLKVVEAEVRFLRDSEGEVDRLVLDQGGERTAKRIE